MINLINLESIKHLPNCLFFRAASFIAIECKHGYDVCPKCDPCSCEAEDYADAVLGGI